MQSATVKDLCLFLFCFFVGDSNRFSIGVHPFGTRPPPPLLPLDSISYSDENFVDHEKDKWTTVADCKS